MEQSKSKLGNIFDVFARNMFGRIVIFADFLKNYGDPEFVEHIDLAEVMPFPTHVFGKDGTERIVDLIFQCPLRLYATKTQSKRNVFAVIIFEHQSTTLREIPIKLLKYASSIWESEKKAKKPFSSMYFIVLRTGKKPHRKPYPTVSDGLAKDAKSGKLIGSTIDVSYDVIDLPVYDADKLIGIPHLRLVLGLLKKMTEGDEETFGDAMLPMREFETLEEQTEWLRELLPFVSKAFASHNKRLEKEDLNREVEKIFDERTDNMMLTIFDEAELKGKAKGKAEGEIKTILTVLKARFRAEVPERIVRELQSRTDEIALQSLAVAAAICISLDEFEAELR